MRVGLVLGGGAVQGGLWLDGALAALAEETGWNPAEAEIIVGTSVGSWIGTLLAAGVPPWLSAAQSAGERIDGLLPGQSAPLPVPPTLLAWLSALRPYGSPSLFLRAATHPRPLHLTQLLAGWLPRGVRDSGAVELVREVVPTGWPEHPGLRTVACDYRTGRRTVFGPGGPAEDVAHAVAASCAVPLLFAPVRIGSREYVDGGVHSASNLDLLAEEELDLVICLTPMTSLDVLTSRRPADLVWSTLRTGSGRVLGREARTLRRRGIPVILLQPRAADLELFGSNWLRPKRAAEIVAQARRSVAEELRESPMASMLEALPPSDSDMVRRPAGPPERWPALRVPPRLAA